MEPVSDNSDDAKIPPSLAESLEGKLERIRGIAPPKKDWHSVPVPHPITDEKMQYLYAVIYHGFTAKYKLERVEISLLAIIAAAADSERNGWCYMSQASLKKLCGVSIPTISAGLKRLTAKGLLERDHYTRGETVRLRLSLNAQNERRQYATLIKERRKNKKQL
jgi:DNA-binding MarR family transcriptional regulator